MNKSTLIIGIIALIFFSAHQSVFAEVEVREFSWQNPQVQEGVYPAALEYRGYYHNYPHDVPPDYVYRTGRVFSPSSSGFNWRNPQAFFHDDYTEHSISSRQELNTKDGVADNGLPQRVQELANLLMASAEEDFTDEYVLTVSTFVNLNDLYVTSSLGRYLAEQLMADLQLRGAKVVEIRKTPGIMIRQKAGEYGLSRDMDELSFVQGAQAMVAGTYTISGERIFLNAKLLRNSDNLVLATASLVVGIDREIRHMLADEKSTGRKVLRTSATVPIRSFGRAMDTTRTMEE